jgi:hypothetical protein
MTVLAIVRYPFPVKGGSLLVPISTVLDWNDATSLSPWGLTTSSTPPVNCQAQDQAGYNLLRSLYSDWEIPATGPGIVRTPGGYQ